MIITSISFCLPQEVKSRINYKLLREGEKKTTFLTFL